MTAWYVLMSRRQSVRVDRCSGRVFYHPRKTTRETDRHIANVAFAGQLMGSFYQGADALLIQSEARRQVSRPEGFITAPLRALSSRRVSRQICRYKPASEVQVALATSLSRQAAE
jgi:hypothetical protein